MRSTDYGIGGDYGGGGSVGNGNSSRWLTAAPNNNNNNREKSEKKENKERLDENTNISTKKCFPFNSVPPVLMWKELPFWSNLPPF